MKNQLMVLFLLLGVLIKTQGGVITSEVKTDSYTSGVRQPWNSDYWNWQTEQFELKYKYYKGKMNREDRQQYRVYRRFMRNVSRNGYNYRNWRKYNRDRKRIYNKFRGYERTRIKNYLKSKQGKRTYRKRYKEVFTIYGSDNNEPLFLIPKGY